MLSYSSRRASAARLSRSRKAFFCAESAASARWIRLPPESAPRNSQKQKRPRRGFQQQALRQLLP